MEAEKRVAPEKYKDVLLSISEIILENFMSYEYGRIPLKKGINIITGPNGAGKSTILLAISVALGQAYTERSRKLSDLSLRVHHESKRRDRVLFGYSTVLLLLLIFIAWRVSCLEQSLSKQSPLPQTKTESLKSGSGA